MTSSPESDNTRSFDDLKVTIERVTAAMSEFGITLDSAGSGDQPVAFANLNGVSMLFAAMPSVLLVRGDVSTTSRSVDAEPSYYLAANQLNATSDAAKMCIVDKTSTLIVRAEAETMSAAGLDDRQLRHALKSGVDAVLGLHEAFEKAHAAARA
ncbi:YbjN domain-containing protein [Corynebacterium vitaeruminis]|uniref:Sensory transduction regulator n=1 Tax=Corynebacterium vitaeruminis DSM 20294 TaxID=1224164 RepID=W5Y8V4_9CORY|nr:YbjN domain-containing protein [Corynebacterium vitaeruminis]AHI22898.1 hypothetical protein B843_07565 [Corynebacterium vitaeruminis DSM 20294]